MLCRATQDGWVIVKSSDKMWSTGGGNGNPFQYSSCKNLMDSMNRQKDKILEDEPLRSEGIQYATGKEWRNSARKNKEAGPKLKQLSVVDMSGGESKV